MRITNNNFMEKQERTVIHLEFKGSHYYFGSIKAMTEQFPPEAIGISYGSLVNYGLSETNTYKNSKCVIRKGILKTIERGRSNQEQKRD